MRALMYEMFSFSHKSAINQLMSERQYSQERTLIDSNQCVSFTSQQGHCTSIRMFALLLAVFTLFSFIYRMAGRWENVSFFFFLFFSFFLRNPVEYGGNWKWKDLKLYIMENFCSRQSPAKLVCILPRVFTAFFFFCPKKGDDFCKCP